MKRIVFVDDDEDLLNGLRARLYKRRAEWDMVFVNSGVAALEELKKQRAHLIISDVRMPGMDGGELLTTIKAGWPETIRIVMSGYADPVKMMQLVSLAHRYVSKPCDAQQLENIIERCFKLDDLLHGDKLKHLVGRIGALPALPKTYSQLQTALARPSVQAGELADIISRDPIVAAKVLQVVNSAFFRLAKPIATIKQAINYLGFSTVRNLVMSAEVFSQWEKVNTIAGLEPERLQANAERTAAACVALSSGTPMMDDALLVGLLHDIGYWVLLNECPAELSCAFAHADATGSSSEQAEREIIGASHAEIGAYLLGLWGFSYQIVEAVAYHHVPRTNAHADFDLLAVLSTAHTLMTNDEPSTLLVSSEQLPIMNADEFELLNPPFSWEVARQRVSDSSSVE